MLQKLFSTSHNLKFLLLWHGFLKRQISPWKKIFWACYAYNKFRKSKNLTFPKEIDFRWILVKQWTNQIWRFQFIANLFKNKTGKLTKEYVKQLQSRAKNIRKFVQVTKKLSPQAKINGIYNDQLQYNYLQQLVTLTLNTCSRQLVKSIWQE